MLSHSDYIAHDATGLAGLVRTGQATPAELAEAAIARIEAHNAPINAVIHKLYDMARERAAQPFDGPFAGVPFLIKDLAPASLAGAPLHNGNRAMRGFVARADSEMVRRWKAAGLNPIGKTNTPEFGLTPFTEPESAGPTFNPWDRALTPGGSSGGSAAAVAARFVPLASAGDGGGSIRIPASACGLFGLKPSRGRNPVGPPVSEGWGGLVAEHVVSRSVRDSAALLDATHGVYAGSQYSAPSPQGNFLAASQRDPGRLRIAFTTASFIGSQVQTHADCASALAQTVRLLTSMGHEVMEDAPPVNAAELAIAFVTGLAGSVSRDLDATALGAGRKLTSADFEAATWALGQLGKSITAAAYMAALEVFQATTNAVGAWFANKSYDVLLTPTLATPPARIGSLKATPAEVRQLLLATGPLLRKLVPPMKVIEPLALKIFGFIPHTPLFNVTGQPAMSMPLHWNAAGVPIGVQFAGRYGDEETLFALAGQLERAQPWKDKMPELK